MVATLEGGEKVIIVKMERAGSPSFGRVVASAFRLLSLFESFT